MRPVAAFLIWLALGAGCSWAGTAPLAPGASASEQPAASGEGSREDRLLQDAVIFDAVRVLLAAPDQRLWLEMYEFDRPDLEAALEAAWKAGRDVRVIVDRTVPESARTAERLAAAGLPARGYPVDDHRHQIDHVKLLLAGGAALVGGMNWGRHSIRNHDYAIVTRRPPVLRRLADIFEQDWALAGGRPAPLASEPGPVAQTAPGEEVRALLEASLAGAARGIEAEVFVLTDPAVMAALAGARRRGVLVRVLLDPNQEPNRPSFRLLRAAGVDVRWYPTAEGAKLHAKAALFDRQRLLLGSANWSRGGLSINHELDLAVDDQAVAAAFAGRFERDWAASGY